MLEPDDEFLMSGPAARPLGIDEPPRRLDAQQVRRLLPALWAEEDYATQKNKSNDIARTISDRQQRGKHLLDRYRRWAGLPGIADDVDPEAFVRFLFSLKEGLTDSAWRTERSAGLSIIIPLPHENRDRALARLLADTNRRRYQPTHAVFFSEGDFAELQVKIPVMLDDEVGGWISDIIVTLVATGVEPDELGTAFIEKRHGESETRRAWLKVVEGAFGDDVHYRVVEISGLPNKTISIIERTIERSQAWVAEKSFDSHLRKCSRAFKGVCDTLFPERRARYAFLSLRDQCVANALSVYELAEVTAMIGHPVDDIVGLQRKLKRRLAWSNGVHYVSPYPPEVTFWRAVYTVGRQYRDIKAARLAVNKERLARRIARQQGESGAAS